MDLIKNLSPECDVKCAEPYLDTVLGNLKRRQQRAASELSNVTAAIEALEKNPEIANVLELISKVR